MVAVNILGTPIELTTEVDLSDLDILKRNVFHLAVDNSDSQSIAELNFLITPEEAYPSLFFISGSRKGQWISPTLDSMINYTLIPSEVEQTIREQIAFPKPIGVPNLNDFMHMISAYQSGVNNLNSSSSPNDISAVKAQLSNTMRLANILLATHQIDQNTFTELYRQTSRVWDKQIDVEASIVQRQAENIIVRAISDLVDLVSSAIDAISSALSDLAEKILGVYRELTGKITQGENALIKIQEKTKGKPLTPQQQDAINDLTTRLNYAKSIRDIAVNGVAVFGYDLNDLAFPKGFSGLGQIDPFSITGIIIGAAVVLGVVILIYLLGKAIGSALGSIGEAVIHILPAILIGVGVFAAIKLIPKLVEKKA